MVAVLSALSVPAVSRAQQAPPLRVRREIPGFDFRKDGVWRRQARAVRAARARLLSRRNFGALNRSEEHTSELQSQSNLVCRLLLEKKKKKMLIRCECI